MKVTREFLLSIAPGGHADIVDGIVASSDWLAHFGIVSDKQIRMFFGQAAEETSGFTTLTENLFYTSVDRLRQVWPSRFKSDAAAAPYVRNPQKLANLVYNGRMGNRVGSNDGWLTRGSGDGQLTGHDNYVALDKIVPDLHVLDNPDVIRMHPGALIAFAAFWWKSGLNKFADASDIVGLTKAINGGLNGLADRRVFTDRAMHWNETAPAAPVDTSGWLRKGSSDITSVAVWQKSLSDAGYYKGGAIDGNFGDGTEDATKHFQTDHGLVADGVVGPATFDAMRNRVPTPANPHSNPPSGPADSRVLTSEGGGLAAIIGALIKALLSVFSGRG